MENPQDKGKHFEEEIAYIYKTMGYGVQKNVSIQGHQIDIVVTARLPGGLSTKTAVECKFKEKGNLTKNEAMDNINALRDIRANNEVQNLLIITTNGFAKDLWGAAEANNIKLITVDELQIEVINLNSYIDKIIYDFENFVEYSDGQRKPIIDLFQRANLYKYYIDLKCRDSNNNIYEPIDKYIEDWLNKENRNHITILGDYGTGKSSFLLYMTYVFAKSFKENPFSVPIPFFISLRKYKYIRDIKEQIIDILKNDYNVIIPSPLYFQKLLEDGKIILLLDGFDEMESKSNKNVILNNFQEITKLVTNNSKIILTSRTHYFKTHSQVENIFNPQYDTELLKMVRNDYRFEILELLEFDNYQIIEFLSRHSEEYMQLWYKIKATYNLEDLSKRPILLEMIIRSLPAIMKGGKTINSAELYNIYTNIWIERDDWRSVMNPEEKTIFMEELALYMYLNEIQEVHFTLLNKIVLNHFKRKINSREEEDIFDTDTRNCSFLNRDYSGNYKFIHKSFMEFFVSKRFIGEILSNNINNIKEKPLAPEITDFISKMITDKNKLYNIVYLTYDKKFDEVKYLGGNAISILNLLGETFTKKDFSHCILRNANFEGSVCDNTDFSQSELQNSNFLNTSLLFVNFEGSNLDSALIENVGYTTYISLDRKGQFLAFGTINGHVFIVERSNLKKTKVFRETKYPITRIRFFNKDSLIGFSDSKNNIFVFSASIGNCTFKLTGSNINGVDFNPSRSEIVLLDKKGCIKFIDLESKVEESLEIGDSSNASINNIVFYSDKKLMIADKSNILLIDKDKKEIVRTFKSQLNSISNIDYKIEEDSLYVIENSKKIVKEIKQECLSDIKIKIKK